MTTLSEVAVYIWLIPVLQIVVPLGMLAVHLCYRGIKVLSGLSIGATDKLATEKA